jgi:hypothetical protein
MNQKEQTLCLHTYNQQHYAGKAEYITGFLFKVASERKHWRPNIHTVSQLMRRKQSKYSLSITRQPGISPTTPANRASLLNLLSRRPNAQQLVKESHCVNIIKKYLEFRDYILQLAGRDESETYELVLSAKGEPVKPGKAFTVASQKVYGKPIPQGTFRKIFETGAHQAGLSDGERKLYSEHALHSVQVAEDYYVTRDVNQTVCRRAVLFIHCSLVVPVSSMLILSRKTKWLAFTRK